MSSQPGVPVEPETDLTKIEHVEMEWTFDQETYVLRAPITSDFFRHPCKARVIIRNNGKETVFVRKSTFLSTDFSIPGRPRVGLLPCGPNATLPSFPVGFDVDIAFMEDFAFRGVPANDLIEVKPKAMIDVTAIFLDAETSHLVSALESGALIEGEKYLFHGCNPPLTWGEGGGQMVRQVPVFFTKTPILRFWISDKPK